MYDITGKYVTSSGLKLFVQKYSQEVPL